MQQLHAERFVLNCRTKLRRTDGRNRENRAMADRGGQRRTVPDRFAARVWVPASQPCVENERYETVSDRRVQGIVADVFDPCACTWRSLHRGEPNSER